MTRILAWLCILCSVLTPVLAQVPKEETWKTADGGQFRLLNDNRPRVLFFLMTDCPIANLYAPEIGRFLGEYESKKVSVSIVYVDTGITAEAAKHHGKEYKLPSNSVLDPSHSLAKAVGATVSPEAVVLDAKGSVVYSGRIDDRVVDYGKVRTKPTRQDLRMAVDQLLQGKRVEKSRTKAIGCIFRKP